jgi:hypothetical protein
MANHFINIDPDINYLDLSTDCSYYDIQSIKTAMIDHSKSLKVIHLNIRSTNKNFDEFYAFLSSTGVQFHVIVLTETWLNSPDEWVDVPGFVAYHSVRSDRVGGGVTILVNSSILSEHLSDMTVNYRSLECCSISFSVRSKKYLVIGVYRPPSEPVDTFNRDFFPLISGDSVSSARTIIVGDFNIDLTNNNLSNGDSFFLNEMYSLHFLPKIVLPTRVTTNSSTCIDHIWTNSPIPFKSGIVEVEITDHYPVFSAIPNVFLVNDLITVKFRCIKPQNIANFKDAVTDMITRFNFDNNPNLHTKCSLLCQNLFSIYERTCPIKTKTISVKRLEAPWLTNAIMSSIATKHTLYNQFRAGIIDHDVYKEYRNMLCMLIKTAKRNYYSRTFNAAMGDARKTWKNIRNVLNPNKSFRPKVSLTSNGATFHNPEDTSKIFNDYFSSVATDLENQIPVNNVDPLQYMTPHCQSFVCLPTDSHEVNGLILSFKNKNSDLGSIPSFIYKRIADVLAPVVADLINCSFTTGVFPDFLKIARVIPIYKSGTKTSASNYRPISTLHFLSKVFEKAMHIRLDNYFSRFDIISPKQFGFRKKSSTSDAILQFSDEIYNVLNNKKYLISVMLDFQKAFDTVNHSILLRKLCALGIRGIILDWFQSYLSNRKQFVCIENIHSDVRTVCTGVPQGSILGPLLFIVYINDMSVCCPGLNLVHFADDTTVFSSGSDLDALYELMNRELIEVDRWLCCNKLSLNIAKTQCMIVSNRNKLNNNSIVIRRLPVSMVNQTKFLGIFIDDRLSFKLHVQSVTNKISKSCGILKKLSHFIEPYILKKLYFSLVYPHLLYGVVVWGGSCRTGLAKLQRLQDKSVRLWCVGPLNYHANKLLTVNDIYVLSVLNKFYQYYCLGESSFFFNKILVDQINHEHATRFKTNNNLNFPRVNTYSFKSCFYYRGITEWNKLPNEIRGMKSLNAFKNTVKGHLLGY